ncbi:hypothetical protein MTBBW1_220036 [Desulfamplus magnetovallimortis]|uniref:Uncharacterized protein n=2 Tax=Desulfamplus magnetovallimortis TaxID=1246637 RepID=A0A1W1HCX4_9BACT|nr:hypothetical protein MTBBW1_220036 [Desulfamplus magnetovallimortis]
MSFYREEFKKILDGAVSLLSWNQESGQNSIELSEHSIDILNLWSHDSHSFSQQHHEQIPSGKVTHKNLGNINDLKYKSTKKTFSKYTASSKDDTARVSNLSIKAQIHRVSGKAEEVSSLDLSKPNVSNVDENIFPLPNNLLLMDGDIHARLLFFSEALHLTDQTPLHVSTKEPDADISNIISDPYECPEGELFLKILKAMHLTRQNICLCIFLPLDYTKGIPVVRRQVNQIRNEMEQVIKKDALKLYVHLETMHLKFSWDGNTF